MKAGRLVFAVFSILFGLQAYAASGNLVCNNEPKKVWGTYFTFNASFSDSKNLTEIFYGTVEGSNEAQEQEPVDTFDFDSLQHNPALAASSKEWKNASAFDVSTDELGKAVVYINEETFNNDTSVNGRTIIRLKVDGKEYRLSCYTELDKKSVQSTPSLVKAEAPVEKASPAPVEKPIKAILPMLKTNLKPFVPQNPKEWISALAKKLPTGYYPGHAEGSGKPSLLMVEATPGAYRARVEMSGRSFLFEITETDKIGQADEYRKKDAEFTNERVSLAVARGDVIESKETYGTYGWTQADLVITHPNLETTDVLVLKEIGGSLGAGGNDTLFQNSNGPNSTTAVEAYSKVMQADLEKMLKLQKQNKLGTPVSKRTAQEFEYFFRALEANYPERVESVFSQSRFAELFKAVAEINMSIDVFRDIRKKLFGIEPAMRRVFMQPKVSVHNGNKVKIAFFDADSTLRVSRSGSVSANKADDSVILPNVAKEIARLNKEGYIVAVVSNQGGISKGVITPEIADAGLNYTIDQIRAQNSKAVIHYFDFAEGYDEYRKPNIGMAQELINRLTKSGLEVDLEKSMMIGDSAYKRDVDMRPDGTPGTHFSNADRLFAQNLGVKFIEAAIFFGWRADGIDVIENIADLEAYKPQGKKSDCSKILKSK